jgi:hypothetical protein
MNKLLKWVAFGIEAFLAIPFLGGAFIITSGWTPLFFTGILHAAAIVFLLMSKRMVITGNLLGLAGALLGWIPFLGWFLHLLAAIILFIEAIYMLVSRPARFQ